MKTLSLITEPIVQALGWTLLHAVWQGVGIVLVTAMMLFLLRKHSSALRYRIGIGGLALQIVSSVATFTYYYQPIKTSARAVVSASRAATPYLATGLNYAKVALPWYKQALIFLQLHLDHIVLGWAIGVLVLFVRMIGSWVYVQQLKAEGIRLTDASVQTLFKKLTVALRIRQTVHLFESVRVTTPMVIGFIKPVVLLPIGLATGLSTKQIETILAHELAHIKRHDYLVNLLQSIVEIFYFFHPALWWLSARVREEREHCCDDLAVQICGDKIAFAQALTQVEVFRQTPQLAMGFASKKGVMLHRIRRILGVAEKRQQRIGGNGLILILLLVVGVSVYALQAQDKPTKKTKATNISHTSKDTKFVLDKEGKLTQVIWKKRTLSGKEVEALQQLKQDIEEGKVTFSSVQNAEQKAILTRIMEVENELDKGMRNLAEGLSFLAMDNMEITPPPLPDEAAYIESLAPIEPDSLFEAVMARNHAKMDSLRRLMEPQYQKMEALRLEMEQYEFKTAEIERKMEVLEWKKNKSHDERNKVLEKRNQVLHQENQAKKVTEEQMEKQLALFEEQIKQNEANVQQLNQQLGELKGQIKTARQPIEELESQLQKLEKINEKYAQELERYSDEISHLVPPPPPIEFRAARTPRASVPAKPKKAVKPAQTPKPAIAPVSPNSPKKL